MKKGLAILLLLSIGLIAKAQFKGQIPEQKKYDAKKVIDPTYGIQMYEKLNSATGGDRV